MSAATIFLFFFSGGAVAPPPAPFVDSYPSLVDVDIQYLSPTTDEWTSLFNDVRSTEPIILEYGIRGSTPADRIADSGTLSFALNNGAWNSAETLGYYSPLHPDIRDGFDLNVPIRMVLSQPISPTPYYKFYGRLGNLSVVPGAHAERLVYCTAMDIMDDYARVQMPPVAVQFDSDGGTLVQRILQALPAELQPASVSFETGLETMPVAFDNLASQTMTIREAMNDVCMSEFARLVIVGTTVEPGGLMLYTNRHSASINPFVLCEFDGSDIAVGGLDVPSSRDDVVNKVDVTTHPTRPLTGYEILYSLESSSLLIQNGETFTGLRGTYRDPLNLATQIGGTNMLQPEAIVDYTMNSSQDGSGADLTANFTVGADFTSGTEALFYITNNGGTPAYVTKLQVRGQGIYRTQSQYAVSVPSTTYGQNVMQIDMPYQGSVNVARSVANYLSTTYSRPHARVSSVTFLANRTAIWMANAILNEPGGRIKLSEEVTGITDEEFIINGVRMEIYPSATTPVIWCTWYLEPALTQRMWQLGVTGSMELGGGGAVGNAILGF